MVTVAQTVKPTVNKNLIDNAKYIIKNAKVGEKSGTTGIVDASLQEVQGSLEKGKNLKTPKDLLKQEAVALLKTFSPTLGQLYDSYQNFKNAKNRNGVQRALDSYQSFYDSTDPFTGLKEAIVPLGAIKPEWTEKISNIRQKINAPVDKEREELAQEAQNYGKITNDIAGAAQSVGNMGPSIAVAATTKNPELALMTMAASAKGNYTREAELAGQNLEDAIKIGNAKATAEVLTEKLTGGAKMFGGGTLDDFATKGVNKLIRNKGANFLVKQGIGIAGEQAEEVLSDIFGTLIDRGTIDPNKTYTQEDLKQTLKQTGLSTVILNAITGGYGPTSYKNNALQMQQYQNENIKTPELVESTAVQGAVKQPVTQENITQQQEQPVQQAQEQVPTQQLSEQTQQAQEQNQQRPEILEQMPKENKTIKQKIKDNIYKFRHSVIDHQAGIYDVSREFKNPTLMHKADEIQGAGELSQNMIGKRQTNLEGKAYKNFTDTNGKKVSMGFEKAFDLYKDIPLKAKNEFLVHTMNQDRWNQGIDQFNIPVEESIQKQQELRNKYPDIDKWGENVWQYGKNQLQTMVDGGLVSQKQADEWLEKNPHYSRIQRDVSGSNPSLKTKKGNISVNNQIQSVKGSTLNILPLKETMGQYTQDVIKSIKINQFGQELLKTIGVDSNGNNATTTSIDDFLAINPDVLSKDGKNYSFTIFKNGVPVTLPINEKIYESLQPREIKTIPITSDMVKLQKQVLTNKNPYFALANAAKDAGEMFLYSKYPIYQTLGTYTELFGGRTIGRGINAINNQINNSEKITNTENWVNFFENVGGNSGSYLTNEGFVSSKKPKTLVGKVASTPFDAIEAGNNFIESMPRITEFVNTIRANGYDLNLEGELVTAKEAFIDKNKEKMSKQELEKKAKKFKEPKKSVRDVISEAKYNAAEVTTNFKRGGALAKNLDRNGATFFNASVQGVDKLGRTFTEAFGDAKSGNYKAAKRLFSRAMTLGLLPALLSKLMYGKDKDYEELPDYVKDQYYLFKIKGTTKFIRIPKGRAVSLFESASRRTMESIEGKKNVWEGYDTLIENQIAPNNPLESNILSPWFSVKNNKAWSGNPIVSDYLEEDNPYMQYDAKTSGFSKAVGKGLRNIPLEKMPFVGGYLEAIKSPKKLDYLIDQYSGVIGDVALPSATNYAENENSSGFNAFINPLKNKFTTDSTLNNKTISEYNNLKKQIIADSKNDDATNLQKAKQQYVDGNYSEVKSKISSLYAKQRDIQNNNKLSDSEKYKQNKVIQREIIEYMKEITKDLNNAKETDGVVTIGDKTYVPGKNSYGQDVMKELSSKKVSGAKQAGMSVEEYAKIDSVISNMEADKNEKGKSITGSKKRKAINYLEDSGYYDWQIKAIAESYGWKY